MKTSPAIATIVLVLSLGICAMILWPRQESSPALQSALPIPVAPTTMISVPTTVTDPTQLQVAAVNSRPGDAVPIATRRQMVMRRYPDLVAALGLTLEQAEQFLELLANQGSATAVFEFQNSGDKVSGIPPQELARLRHDLELAQQSAQSAVLGEAYPRWQEHQLTPRKSDEMLELQRLLGTHDFRLSDEQARSLGAAIDEQRHRLIQDLLNSPEAQGKTMDEMAQLMLQRSESDNRQIADFATAYLDSRQLDIYQILLGEQNVSARSRLRRMERDALKRQP